MIDTNLVLACIITALALLVEHWFPWRMLFGRDIPRVLAYIIGVLAMALPLTWLFNIWHQSPMCFCPLSALALWAVILTGGFAVLFAYGVDWLLEVLKSLEELRSLARMKADDGSFKQEDR